MTDHVRPTVEIINDRSLLKSCLCEGEDECEGEGKLISRARVDA